MPGRTRKSNTNTKACSGACGSCRAGDKASGKPGSKPEKKASAQGAPMGGGVVDRRLGLDRRDIEDAKGIKVPSGLERRRGPGRRLSDFTKSAEDGEMTTEQFLFLVAIDEFKKANDRPFPTWTDVLEVVRLLGYRDRKSVV